MTEPLGFVVLARRPGQADEPVSDVFTGDKALERAQNAQKYGAGRWAQPTLDNDPVKYVIGQIFAYPIGSA
ncbi:hypothetical protein A5747_13240 [Mycobacterium sp. IS-836]|uniref:hypothetical protein n=1 Tax=Mycobacterium sp. IS-836 TaxID=1834160 RepID=UPI00096C601F|nr:hypothetical protein [Mycobacterium sp. IS-836]OMC55354.1 hypothetical protein A5747_13240 [Mycobacterium sp. IS-836]